MVFMDQDFLLSSPTAKTLYHNFAENCPIIDYHNHLSVKDIAQRRRFRNLTELWLETDHYKWRAMRACGVDESFITGDQPDWDKFLAWASVVPKLIGSPLYHWTHLELQRYFNIREPLTPDTAQAIWTNACTKLQQPDFDAVRLLERQRAKVLCTTDDPADDLMFHQEIAKQQLSFRVLPSFRPDRFLNPESETFLPALLDLGIRYGVSISCLRDLKDALGLALEHFQETGCKVSDHGFSRFTYGTGELAETAFAKATAGDPLSDAEIADFKGEMLRFLGEEYHKRNIVMQLHMGPLRNANPQLWRSFGADAGGDSIGLTTNPFDLVALLQDLAENETLPRTILYNLNPADNTVFATMAGDFAPKVQYGAAWWFNDTLRGMNNQIEELMETGAIAKSVGMLTDSRSFTSFPRHEYFRRILCAKLATLVEDGLYPNDISTLGEIVEDICWRNAVSFFGF